MNYETVPRDLKFGEISSFKHEVVISISYKTQNKT